MREPRLHDQRRPDDGIAARPGRARLADHLPLRPGVHRAFRRTERKLAEIFLTQNDVLLMQGEAVLGLEAAARSLVHPGRRC